MKTWQVFFDGEADALSEGCTFGFLSIELLAQKELKTQDSKVPRYNRVTTLLSMFNWIFEQL
ncbi:hypothetical protein A33Q_0283 [Indibacter alkaliphilus LW1]|jgi:hypothetical protein|uniref:Uncharacterized protein n=1 Tax=Indibacter alkaliphilus (strain CCUG 57479 / KCTC 22604 / LW1) TaxID=1189612 RepID=S2DL73_INDAL|nr:hypothetical protein [Indibacter alkaliphilus]EOZ99864.1 hypothetical protein A33Q_0283 [Indibacter alkaliphilus LW1]